MSDLQKTLFLVSHPKRMSCHEGDNQGSRVCSWVPYPSEDTETVAAQTPNMVHLAVHKLSCSGTTHVLLYESLDCSLSPMLNMLQHYLNKSWCVHCCYFSVHMYSPDYDYRVGSYRVKPGRLLLWNMWPSINTYGFMHRKNEAHLVLWCICAWWLKAIPAISCQIIPKKTIPEAKGFFYLRVWINTKGGLFWTFEHQVIIPDFRYCNLFPQTLSQRRENIDCLLRVWLHY